ncbi:MAG: DUF4159 domain-containing protein [Kiritimatiellae bacterium]|nr:DUF4159 domain-containing protein [Kiritimatiellia bacterium]
MKLFRILRNFELLEKMAATKGIVTRFVVSLLRSRYFLIAAALYLLLALILAPRVISRYKEIQGVFNPADSIFVRSPVVQKAPPVKQPDISGKSLAAKQPVDGMTKSTVMDSIIRGTKGAVTKLLTGNKSTDYIQQPSVPVPAPTPDTFDGKIGDNTLSAKIIEAERQRIKNVKIFQEGWVQGSSGENGGSRSGPGNVPGLYDHGRGKTVVAKFTIFQAKYQDGDWNCNPNALYNMMLQIRAWSKNRIDPRVVPEVLDIGTDKLFILKPPFVYLTGHKDFRLLENEVKNLRDYLNVGGAIWADSALAGHNSRFDIAFRREMHRVLPDRNFEPVPENHEIFNTFFDNIGLPTGMNYYHEPIEMINIGGKLAVLYTLNGYGHFWEARLNKDGKIQWGLVNVTERGKKPNWQSVHGPHLASPESGIIYRNISDETTRNIYRLGVNVVVHLLTRYQRDFMFLPKELPTSPDTRARASASQTTNTDETVTNAPESKEDSGTAKPGGRRIKTTKSERNFK